MLVSDLEKGTAIWIAIDATRRAGFLTPWLAALFGDRWVIEHLGMRHTLSRWRGTWYHVRIEEVGSC